MPDVLYICATFGVQFGPTDGPPAHCPVCEDERQYVGWSGQKWTTLEELRSDHKNEIRDDNGLTGIGTTPSFAIGQRALLVRTDEGNLLWDCITVLDDATVAAVRELGGVNAIAISHPHYYSTMVEWAKAFDCPVYLHAADQQWVMRPDSAIELWSGETKSLWDGMTLIRVGGHFDGQTVLHFASGQRAAFRRHAPGRAGPALGQLHVQLSQPRAGLGAGGRPYRRRDRAL